MSRIDSEPMLLSNQGRGLAWDISCNMRDLPPEEREAHLSRMQSTNATLAVAVRRNLVIHFLPGGRVPGEDLSRRGQRIARQLLAMPRARRQQWLRHIQLHDPTLAGMVRTDLDIFRYQAMSEEQRMSQADVPSPTPSQFRELMHTSAMRELIQSAGIPSAIWHGVQSEPRPASDAADTTALVMAAMGEAMGRRAQDEMSAAAVASVNEFTSEHMAAREIEEALSRISLSDLMRDVISDTGMPPVDMRIRSDAAIDYSAGELLQLPFVDRERRIRDMRAADPVFAESVLQRIAVLRRLSGSEHTPQPPVPQADAMPTPHPDDSLDYARRVESVANYVLRLPLAAMNQYIGNLQEHDPAFAERVLQEIFAHQGDAAAEAQPTAIAPRPRHLWPSYREAFDHARRLALLPTNTHTALGSLPIAMSDYVAALVRLQQMAGHEDCLAVSRADETIALLEGPNSLFLFPATPLDPPDYLAAAPTVDVPSVAIPFHQLPTEHVTLTLDTHRLAEEMMEVQFPTPLQQEAAEQRTHRYILPQVAITQEIPPPADANPTPVRSDMTEAELNNEILGTPHRPPIRMPTTQFTFAPGGTAHRIRGQQANLVVADEVADPMLDISSFRLVNADGTAREFGVDGFPIRMTTAERQRHGAFTTVADALRRHHEAVAAYQQTSMPIAEGDMVLIRLGTAADGSGNEVFLAPIDSSSVPGPHVVGRATRVENWHERGEWMMRVHIQHDGVHVSGVRRVTAASCPRLTLPCAFTGCTAPHGTGSPFCRDHSTQTPDIRVVTDMVRRRHIELDDLLRDTTTPSVTREARDNQSILNEYLARRREHEAEVRRRAVEHARQQEAQRQTAEDDEDRTLQRLLAKRGLRAVKTTGPPAFEAGERNLEL